MRPIVLLALLALPVEAAVAVDSPDAHPRTTGILVLDDCDPTYDGKSDYADNLTLLDAEGKQTFRVSGFNNCETVGSNRMIATDPERKCIWVIENAGHRLRRFDYAGKEMLAIKDVNGMALAVDPETGNVWVLVTGSTSMQTRVYDGKGQVVATYAAGGWDIVYDRKAKAFWIASGYLIKINAANGKVLLNRWLTIWVPAGLDVDPESGNVWVILRKHPNLPGSSNQLLSFTTEGQRLTTVELGENNPFRVTVDTQGGRVWVAYLRKGVERFSSEGTSEDFYPMEALTVQVDASGGDIWVVTPTEVQMITPKGDVMKHAPLAGKTGEAWIAVLP